LLRGDDLVEESLQIFRTVLLENDGINEDTIILNSYLMLLMAKKQYNSLIKIFNENGSMLKDRYKPTYYALIYFMQSQDEEFKVEYKKVGKEIDSMEIHL